MIPAFSKLGGYQGLTGRPTASKLGGALSPFTMDMLRQILANGGLRFQGHGTGQGFGMGGAVRGMPPGPVQMGPQPGRHLGMTVGAAPAGPPAAPAGAVYAGPPLPTSWQQPSYVADNGAFAYGTPSRPDPRVPPAPPVPPAGPGAWYGYGVVPAAPPANTGIPGWGGRY